MEAFREHRHGYIGLGSVEFKLRPAEGKVYLTENSMCPEKEGKLA